MNGILLLNKPKGLTSHDCVFKLRKMLKTKKIGHTGTLDPDVTGVLPLCVGQATKVVEFLTAENKVYEGEVTLGFSTTTEDASGEIVAEKNVDREISRQEVLQVFDQLTGQIEQTPPMYSAVKVNGKRLYEYARQGIEVERPTRTITIHELSLLDDRELFTNDTVSFRFRISCSKGTYVRTVAVMIGELLGFPAHMSNLIRTESGNFSLQQCLSFDEIEQLVNDGEMKKKLLSLESALTHLPKLQINDKVAEKVKNGAVLPMAEELSYIDVNVPFCMMDRFNHCLALYIKHPEKMHLMKPKKVLVTV
ncbi:tRNA pseudouridine(55) synthase TruB [Cytobacillus sp. IB215665]|uniref:tRNA pseudouridine(55) synthase TruB n=1 Tax=Cytobacillus sp. IB215665 TaxID=3097357 RepID=UPI002A14C2C0|nr:tRNA pseudouridine(55) synthase TruB [Cytobacillus sp. IB215665]MDX8365109.1 tRNA pseudouridine(55) synthase TruB [Cytobacillus sp. IB215665]